MIRLSQTAADTLSGQSDSFVSIIDSLPDATFAIDTHGFVIAWNRAIVELTGVAARDMIGKGDHEYALPFYGERRPVLIDLLRERNDEIEREYRLVKRMENNTLVAETPVARLKGEARILWGTASVLLDAAGCVTGAIECIRDITDRHKAEETLRASEERSRFLLDASFDGLVVAEDGILIDVSSQFRAMLGYEPAEMIGTPSTEYIVPEEREMVRRKIETRDEQTYETRLLRRDGTLLDVEMRARHYTYKGRQVRVTALRDITDRKKSADEMARLQAQLLQAQKMEAIGRLAGGVAHDFNNLLTAVLGNVELLKADGAIIGTARECIDEIEKAGLSAASLTNQLLAFSRKQMLQPRPLNLNTLVENLLKMLRRLIGEDVTLELRLDPHLGQVRADPGQMEQVIVNLAVNARDAMSGGGTFTVETHNVEVTQDRRHGQFSIPPGRYVELSLTDTGMGMSDEVRSHLFEPFFTTKALGKGTGLGLSTVYGIVKQSNGFIGVESESGRGTRFVIDLPRLLEAAAAGTDSNQSAPPARGTETILVVEDEAAVLRLMRTLFEKLGYRVIGERHPNDALAAIDALRGEPLDLLVSDIVLPGMNGTDLARQARERRPQLKVLFISGYMDESLYQSGVLAERSPFLKKPFSSTALAQTVRDVLDGRVPPEASDS